MFIKNYQLGWCFATFFLSAMERPDTFVFSHGLGSNAQKARWYEKAGIILPVEERLHYQGARPGVKRCYACAALATIWKSALGQVRDARTLACHINGCDYGQVVLFGESCGASTIINCLGSRLISPDRIKAIVLDSPFDCVKNVIAYRLQRFKLNRLVSAHTVEKIISWFFRYYDTNGVQPCDVVRDIPKDLPILLICSKADKEVPWTSSVALYEALVQSGHDKAHLVVLENGDHGRLVSGQSGRYYHQEVHAFYERYGIKINRLDV